MIQRRRIVPLLLVLLITASSNAIAAPRITISIYAPLQKDAPVDIVGFDYGQEAVQVSLSNVSDKLVADVRIVGVLVAPAGCAAEPRRVSDIGGYTYVGHPLQISPRGRAVTSLENSPFNPGDLVVTARHFGYGSLHVQVGVLEVDFADGTKWIWKPDLPRDEVLSSLFDPSLVNTDTRACVGAAAVTQALDGLDGRVVFDRKLAKPSCAGGEGVTVPPQVLFTCSP